jgi:hypothetical protein
MLAIAAPRGPRAALSAALALVLLAAGARTSAAAPEDERERAVRAKKACAAAKVEEGVEILAGLFAETNDLTYVYNQGRCYQQNGIPDKAINRFREYLRRATDITAEDRREVEQFIVELEKQQAAAPPAAVVAGPAAESDAGTKAARLRAIGLGLGAASALAVATGVVLSLKVRSSERNLEQEVTKSQGPYSYETFGAKMRDGARLETFQWVAYAVGAAALAGGTTCYVLGMRGRNERPVAFAGAPALDGRGFAAWMRVRY